MLVCCCGARTAIGFLIFIGILGPLLMIVGIVILVRPNTRTDDVNKYNAAVAAYQSAGTASAVAAFNGSVGNPTGSFTATTTSIDVVGSQEGVVSATSTSSRAVLTTQVSSTFTTTMSTGPSGLSVSIPLVQVFSRDVYCDSTTCDDCIGTLHCSSGALTSYCRSQWGTQASYSGVSTCSENSRCGTCNFIGYLASACVVVTPSSSNATWVRSSVYDSCLYPFTSSSHLYSTSSATSVKFELRSANDPFIALQAITKGKQDFGLTAAQQATIGAACLIIGIIITIVMCGGVACLCCRRQQEQNPQKNTTIVIISDQSASQQQQPPQEMQPVYGHPVPYGAPQPMYDQPPQAYAYPPPSAGYAAYPPAQPGPPAFQPVTFGPPSQAPYQQGPVYGQPPPQPAPVKY